MAGHLLEGLLSSWYEAYAPIERIYINGNKPWTGFSRVPIILTAPWVLNQPGTFRTQGKLRPRGIKHCTYPVTTEWHAPSLVLPQ